jgi:hypothetical protein
VTFLYLGVLGRVGRKKGTAECVEEKSRDNLLYKVSIFQYISLWLSKAQGIPESAFASRGRRRG